MAMFDAVTIMVTNPEPHQASSVYETKQLLMV